MATRTDIGDLRKRRLARDPNTPADAQQLLSRVPVFSPAVAASAVGQAVPTRPLAPRKPEPIEPEPTPTPPDPLSAEQRAGAEEIGRSTVGYLGERKRLAPGVRRWGSNTADPAEVYMTVDRNGNRVYTDDAQFAAGQSRGSLSRRDLAPGMAESDRDRTLNDPEGGFTYAPASPGYRQALQGASNFTRGGSKAIERALGEADRSQAIADTRAGNRPIDEQRKEQAGVVRRRLGIDDSGGLDIRDLIALQANDRAERQFDFERQKFGAEQERAGAEFDTELTDKQVNQVLSVRAAIEAGTLDPEEGDRIIASTIYGGDIDSPAGRATESAANRRLRERTAANNRGLGWFRNFGFDSDEAQDVTIDNVRVNEDGSVEVVEPDIGMFDQGDTTGLSRRDVESVGSDESLEALLQYSQNRRRRRGE